MLKTASIFKDFRISVNADNTAVTFYKVSPLSVSVKNDNFSTQVQILDNDDTTDLFDYKYITFDDSAVFEIKDCIKNEKYTTLFIQYLSNITFDTENSNFRVDGVSVATLQRLGFDINQFAEILGNSLKIDYINYKAEDIAEQEYFIFGIKLRFSELPQNLNYRFTGVKNEVTLVTDELNVGNNIFNPSIANIEIAPDNLLYQTSIDNAKTVIIPMPLGPITFLQFTYANTYGFEFKDVIATLSELITNLTLTVEIIPITSNTLVFMHDFSPKNIAIEKGSLGTEIIIPDVEPDMAKFTNMVRVPSGLVNDGVTRAAPCFVMDGMVTGTGASTRKWNICEVFDFIKINLPENAANESYINAIILNNFIDISKIKENYFYIKRENGYIRIYIDIEKNIYTDIVNTLEFAKNAYSNFEAYQKSNIELVNSQNLAALQQQQQQKRNLQTVSSVTNGVNTAIGAISQFASGNIAGGITSILSGGANIASEEIKFNMQQQNEIANNKLAAAQALERARSTITPSSDLKGSISLTTALKGAYNADINYITPIILSKITLTDMQLYSVQKYIFDSAITEKVNDQKNLFDISTLTNNYNVDTVITDSDIIVTATSIGTFRRVTSQPIFLKAGTYYLDMKREIISGTSILSDSTSIAIYNALDDTFISNGRGIKTFTEDIFINIQLYLSRGTALTDLVSIRFYDLSLKHLNHPQITKPEWQTLDNYYQVKIANRSAINTRKDLIIFVEDAAEDAAEDATEDATEDAAEDATE